jgi:hypothetical protein
MKEEGLEKHRGQGVSPRGRSECALLSAAESPPMMREAPQPALARFPGVGAVEAQEDLR